MGDNETNVEAGAALAPLKLADLHREAYRHRERIAALLGENKARRQALDLDRAVKVAEIERLRLEVTRIDEAIEARARERDDLVAMETALADQQLALERQLIRRSYE
jgi:hypothetical protein